MLWVLKITVSKRRFFWAPKTYVKTDGKENNNNFTLKNFVYLNLWLYQKGLKNIVHPLIWIPISLSIQLTGTQPLGKI